MARIDKYLWCIRVFKTRSDATDACKGGKVKLNGSEVKPSRDISEGDELEIRKSNIRFSFKVVAIPPNRLPAKLVPDYAINTTPPEELEKLHAPKESLVFYRDHGTGRPTKKDRRDIDSLMEDFFNSL